MDVIEAIFLGILQGATEFLPVSSSGHSVLVPRLLNMGEPSLDLIAIAHQGTLLAVLIYFWSDVWQIAGAVLAGLAHRRPLESEQSRLGWYIFLGTLPVALVGLTLRSFFEEVFGEPVYASFFLLVTAGLLVLGERMLSGEKELSGITWVDGLIVGVFQAAALFPGISRSGSTIVGGLWRGLDRETAARFSFLLGIPAIAGAGLLAMLDLLRVGDMAELPGYVAAFLAAAISGYAAIAFLLNWLRRHSLYPFAIYCALFGLVTLFLALTGNL